MMYIKQAIRTILITKNKTLCLVKRSGDNLDARLWPIKNMTSSFKMGFLDKQLIQRVNTESCKMSLKHLVPENKAPVKDNWDGITRTQEP